MPTLARCGAAWLRAQGMKLLLDSLIIFFGTMLAAAVVAWGEPAEALLEVPPVSAATPPPR